MIKFRNAEQAGKILEVSQDHVRHLIRQHRLKAKKVGGPKGDNLIHPVDINRLHTIRCLSTNKQEPSKPDLVWVIEACNFLIQQVQAAEFQPLLIVGIAYGGLFPASLISSILHIPFYSLRIIHYDGTVQRSEVTVIPDTRQFDNISTLVVDDIVDSGDTLVAAQGYLSLRGIGVDNLKFATLHKKPGTKFEPNWYVDVAEGWIYYPWEMKNK